MTESIKKHILAHRDQAASVIRDALLAMPAVTVRPIPLDRLGPLLRTLGLMSGLRAIAADAQTDAAIRAGITDFLDQLADVRCVSIDTTDPTIAARTAAVIDGLQSLTAALGLDHAETVASIYALGGGLAYQPVPSEQAIADLAELEDWRDAQLAEYDSKLAALTAWRHEIEAGNRDATPPWGEAD